MSLRPLVQTIAFIFAGQAAAASIFVPLKTEKFYDLCGSLGFLSAIALSIRNTPLTPDAVTSAKVGGTAHVGLGAKLWNALGSSHANPAITQGSAHWTGRLILNRHPRQLIASALVVLWAARLGTFLFQRVMKVGKDSRFDEIKQKPLSFLGAWFLQGCWISITALPVYMLNSLPARSLPALGILDLLALSVYGAAWGLEIIADRTKSQWREEKNDGKHDEKFLTRGVWSWSRHPNYFGEVSLWGGQAMLAIPTLAAPIGLAVLGPYAPYAALSSPILEYALIRFISGVNMLEESSDKKFSDDPKYKEYKERVPCFVPFVGTKN